MSGNKKINVFNQILIAVIVAFLIGGTAPWWWQELFGERPVHKEPPSFDLPSTTRRPDYSLVKPREEEPIVVQHQEEEPLAVWPGKEGSAVRFVTTRYGAKLFRKPSLFEPVIALLPEGRRFQVRREQRDRLCGFSTS